MDAYLYILHCSDGTYFTDVTNDLVRRVSDHIEGSNPYSYTFEKRPVKLVYYEKHADVETAFERVNNIRDWSQDRKRMLVEGIVQDI